MEAIDLTQVVVSVVLSIIGVATAAFTRIGLSLLRSRLTAQQFAFVADVAKAAVNAAEQQGLTGEINNKLDYAFLTVEQTLAANGINISGNLIRDAIEAAVWEEINQFRNVQLSPTVTSIETTVNGNPDIGTLDLSELSEA